MELRKNRKARAFSLVELVIVIVIIGVIAAIAIPRVTKGLGGAADSALRGDLSVFRNAIEMYASEHKGKYPAEAAATAGTSGGSGGAINTEDAFICQLTMFSDADGKVNATPTEDGTGTVVKYPYGPYLAKGIPPLPIPNKAGTRNSTTVKVVSGNTTVAVGGDFGWVYSATTGVIIANSDAQDSAGTLYSAY